LTSGRPDVKIIAESLSQHDEKHVVPTPLSGIRVGGRKIRLHLNFLPSASIYIRLKKNETATKYKT
jgi:hypothetical protein